MIRYLIRHGSHCSSVFPSPSCPEEFAPNEYTSPFDVTTMLCPGPATTWDFPRWWFFSPINRYIRTSFQEPPHRSFSLPFSSLFIDLKMAFWQQVPYAATSGRDSVASGSKSARLLKNVHAAWTTLYYISIVIDMIRSIFNQNTEHILYMVVQIKLASKAAISLGSSP